MWPISGSVVNTCVNCEFKCVAIASLIKQFSGRKRESDIHKHFRYSMDDYKSICVVTPDDDKECNF